MSITPDLTNKKFGKLLVIHKMEYKKNKCIIWECKCDCGEYSYVRTSALIRGKIKNCNHCLRKKHEMCNSRIYHIWEGLKGRCLNSKNKDYKNYGGRGITICKEWEDFKIFWEWSKKNGYSDSLTIDRIDNNKDYEPLNCRWTIYDIQNSNKRKTKFININGELKTLRQWAKNYNLTEYWFKKKILENIKYETNILD